MNEHVHEWQLITDWWQKSNWFRCRGCGAEIEIDRAERRLNATDRLEEVNKGLFNIIKAYHPAYIDGCECPQCSDMPIYFDDILGGTP